MKMSENDHTNSLDPDQDQQKRLAGPEGERSVMPQSHTNLRTLAESFRSNRNRPQKNEGGA